MLKELVIATNNAGKLTELRALLPTIELLTLKDIGFLQDIPEPYPTFRENAHIKASTVNNFCGKAVMADDSGICIDHLNGGPGVLSARYAGTHATDEENVQRALSALEGAADRNAHYKAVICLITPSGTHYFEGECHGRISASPQGKDGFGYDPIFMPDGYEQTFAQLPLSLKNELSHRGKAVRSMVQFLADNV